MKKKSVNAVMANKQLKERNYVVLGVLLVFVGLIFGLALVRMAGN